MPRSDVSDVPGRARPPLSSRDADRAHSAKLRSIGEMSLFVVGLLIFGVLGLAFTLIGVPLRFLLPRRIGMPLGQRVMRKLFGIVLGYMRRTGIARFDLSALDGLEYEQPLVLAPNHPSLFDAVLIVSRLSRVACTMKASVVHNPVLGGGAALAGYVPNNNPKQLVQQSVARLQQGCHVLVFPEGTRTVGYPIGPLRGSFALIAKYGGVPVQTLLIESNSRFLSKGWTVFRKPQFPLVYRVRLGQRFDSPVHVKQLIEESRCYFVRELTRGE